MQEAGLEVSFDAAGNLAGRLRGSEPALPEVWSGSHLDTPPDGGRFDGALGTLLALDAAEAIAADGPPRRTLAALGVPARGGPALRRRLLRQPRALRRRSRTARAELADADGVSLGDALAALGYGELPAEGWLEPAPACFVEAHIEQGPSLAAAGAPLGIVSSIAAMAGYRAHVQRAARARRHRADGAALRRAGSRGAARRRGARAGAHRCPGRSRRSGG